MPHRSSAMDAARCFSCFTPFLYAASYVPNVCRASDRRYMDVYTSMAKARRSRIRNPAMVPFPTDVLPRDAVRYSGASPVPTIRNDACFRLSDSLSSVPDASVIRSPICSFRSFANLRSTSTSLSFSGKRPFFTVILFISPGTLIAFTAAVVSPTVVSTSTEYAPSASDTDSSAPSAFTSSCVNPRLDLTRRSIK